jgi:hypothetical protein
MMPRNKHKHPVSRYERLMLAAINSLPFTFNSPGEPNMSEGNQQNRRMAKEEQRPFKRIDTPVREHATDKRYPGGRVTRDPDAFYQSGERGYSKARHPKTVPGHSEPKKVSPPRKASLN